MTDKRSRPIEISAQKAEELLNLFRRGVDESIGEHLSEDQFLRYVTGDLPEQEMLSIDRHIEKCKACGNQLEHLAVKAMAWSEAVGAQRLKKLRRQALENLSANDTLSPSVFEELARQIGQLLWGMNLGRGFVSAATEEEKPFEQGDQWSCYLNKDKRGNYTLRISSRDLSLEGTRLKLHSTNWQQEITLVRVEPNQVGAKVVLSPEDLARIPQGHDFRIEFLHQGREQE
jgi:hypothetical protein